MTNSTNFFELLNSLSTEISYKILVLYSEQQEGINLTNTAQLIDEKTSTVRDYLNRLLDVKCIYRINKDYYLSNFGSLILDYLKKMKNYNILRDILGNISAGAIPTNFIEILDPIIQEIEIKSDQWQFMNVSNKLINQIQNDMGQEGIKLKVLGWRSLTLSLNIIQNYFNKVTLERYSIQQFLENTNFKLISDKGVLKEIHSNEKLKNIVEKTDINEKIYVYEEVENFPYTLIKYNETIQFFLNKGEEMKVGKYFTLENNETAKTFFNEIFDYFKKKSKPLSLYL
ncbi:MAG: hypothetical protein R6U96_14195 [Promethearchaeia archaeon]